MSGRAFQWALNEAPMLTTERGHKDTTARFVLVALADKAHGDPPVSYVSVPVLGVITGFDRTVIQRALDRLSVAGLIAVAGKRGKTIVWRLDMSQTRGTSVLEEVNGSVELERGRARERMRRLRGVRAQNPNIDTRVRVQHTNSADSCSCATPERGPDVRAQDPNVRVLCTNTQCSRVLNGKDEQEPPSIPPPSASDEDALLPLASLADARPDLSTTPSTASTGAAPDLAVAFAAFWAAYPKRVGKKDAERKFNKAVKDGTNPADIIAGAKRYAEFRSGQDQKYTKHPGTWLNQGCWSDEITPERRGLRTSQGHQAFRNPDDQSVYDEEFY